VTSVNVAESNENGPRSPQADFHTLLSMGAATVHEVVMASSVLPAVIVPIVKGAAMCGPAFTVDTGPGDNLWIHRAIYLAPVGAILVVSCGHQYEYGYWGEILSTAAAQRKLGGVLIDGHVRDVEALQAIGFPVFARGLCVRGTGKYPGRESGVGKVISIGDAPVAPGDLILGDADGVICLPATSLKSALLDGAQRLCKERKVLDGLRAGETSLDLLGLDED
jgi:4-hydroxy-4-methyl-2-oxoglutarate aldolase